MVMRARKVYLGSVTAISVVFGGVGGRWVIELDRKVYLAS